MLIDQEKCTGCGLCMPYCVARAISKPGDKAVIDQEACVECGVCLQVGCCEFDAIVMDEIEWPRLIRRIYSNVLFKHPATGMTGRGTPEMKNNEITGKFPRGMVGLGVELGRPDVCAYFRDVDKVSRALAAKGFEFDPKAPTTLLMEDPATGALREDVLGERVICAIVEGKSPAERLPDLLQALSEVAKEIDTVFSLDMMTMAGEDGSVPTVETARGLGYAIRPNAKASLGMGRHCPARQG